MSIFLSPDVKYDKSFVTHAIIFIQKNKIDNFDEYKHKILTKISNLKDIKSDSKKMLEINKKRIENEYRRLNEAEKIYNRVNHLKFRIFYMMKKIIVKNINNFHKLCKNSSLGAEYSNNDEMESECFLIFETCLKKFKIDNQSYDFYFYFNKAISRSLYKIFTDAVDVKSSEYSYSDFSRSSDYSENEFLDRMNKDNYSQKHSIDFVLSNMNLNEDDIMVVKSKMMKESLSTFLDKNPDFGQKKYQNCLKKIKKELINLKQENHG